VNNLNSFFPLSAKATTGKGLAISIICYLLLSVVTGFVLGFLTRIAVIGPVISFVSQLIDLYCLGGIVVSIMKFAKVL